MVICIVCDLEQLVLYAASVVGEILCSTMLWPAASAIKGVGLGSGNRQGGNTMLMVFYGDEMQVITAGLQARTVNL